MSGTQVLFVILCILGGVWPICFLLAGAVYFLAIRKGADVIAWWAMDEGRPSQGHAPWVKPSDLDP